LIKKYSDLCELGALCGEVNWLLVAVPPRYFRAGITRRAKRSMD
jgi:hypothetical protein